MEDLNTRRVVLMGKSGSGKSSLANTTFRAPVFQVNHSSDAKSTFSQAQTRHVNGLNLTLIDTPGIFNADRSKDQIECDVFSCLTQSAPGPHAFLIVLLIEKFTEQEQAIIDHIQLHFGEDVFKFATVVFTRGDQLPEGMEMAEYVAQNLGLSDLVRKCGNRCHVVDNKYWNDTNQNEYRSNMFQLKAILNSIEDTFNSNNNACFISDAFREVEKCIQKEQDRIHKSEGLSLEESRDKAKKVVLENFIRRRQRKRIFKNMVLGAGLLLFSYWLWGKSISSFTERAVPGSGSGVIEVLPASVVEVVQDAVAPMKSTFDYIIETIEAVVQGGRWGLANTTQIM